MDLIAHSCDDGRKQPFEEHARGVAKLAGDFAAEFGAGAHARLAGLLHDAGKCAPDGQKRLRGELLRRVEHSAAAAELLYGAGGTAARLLAYCAAGHHAGLPDGVGSGGEGYDRTLMGKLGRQKLRAGDYLAYRRALGEIDIAAELPALAFVPREQGFEKSFWARMVFSCLVDADFLDTEAFMKDRPLRLQPEADMQALLDKLKQRLAEFPEPSDELGFKRRQVQEDCLRMAQLPRGLFTLSVPTGGGKTLSSLAFALAHAVRNGLRRVIYVIPYTSIIEQTADVFREALGGDVVLEHHSSVKYDREDEETDPLRLAAENWDLPVVVTTGVQFFESLFANKPSRCRKLHNIANSVVIFDEAQMFPPDLLFPCVKAIGELVRGYRCTAVICSATQPALDALFAPALIPKEICSDHKQLYEALRRVCFAHIGEAGADALAQRLNGMKQALCVVNTREQARTLYEKLTGEGTFHLSTLMTPLDRRRALAVIRKRLDEKLPCRVVSTSLIEAGVDVDFPCVFREEAGVDSVIQAAGRCNREGKLKPDDAVVHVFRPEEKYAKKCPALVKTQIGAAQMTRSSFADIASPEAIRYYFTRLNLLRREALDAKNIVRSLDACAKNGLMVPFATVAEQFKVIDTPARSVFIPVEERAGEIAAALRAGRPDRKLMREAGQYTVSVYENQFHALFNCGALEPLAGDLYALRDERLYSEETGLCVPKDGGQGIYT